MNMVDTNLSEEDIATSSEEDEAAELITEDVEKGFLKVFNQLKNKDPEIYKGDIKYFSNKEEKNFNSSYKKKNQKVRDKKNHNESDANSHDNFWTSKNLNDDEKFLRDYILNKKFLGGDDIDMEEELKKLREEEKELAEEAMFEYKYNNRFEEQPDEEFVKKYPHTLGIVTKHKKNLKGTPKEAKNSQRHLEQFDAHQSKKFRKIKSEPNTNPNSRQESSSESIDADQSKKVKKKHKENKEPSNLGMITGEFDGHQPSKLRKIKSEPNMNPNSRQESSSESIDADQSKKVKKKHKEYKEPSDLGMFTGELTKAHFTEIQNGAEGFGSITSLDKSKIRKIKELNVGKRKLSDSMEAQSKMNGKIKKSKLVANVDQNQPHEDLFKTVNKNQMKKVKISQIESQSTKEGKNIKISKSAPIIEQTHKSKSVKTDKINKSGNMDEINHLKKDKTDSQVRPSDTNEKLVKKKRKTKNKDNKRSVKQNNALVRVGNVKLKKMLRYKSRRKKHLASNKIKSEDVTLKLVQQNGKKSVNVEKLTINNLKNTKKTDNVKEKNRKRSRRKPSGGGKGVSNTEVN